MCFSEKAVHLLYNLAQNSYTELDGTEEAEENLTASLKFFKQQQSLLVEA